MSKINPEKLLITANFYSCQGEGKTTGVPAYFVRLGICNLSCGFSKSSIKDLIKRQKKQEIEIKDGQYIVGDLETAGKATWSCDSVSQWALRGEEKEFQFLIDEWKREGIYEDILKGIIHIIWTGGEPTILQHQESIVNFIDYWARYENSESALLPDEECIPFHEIETNGTIYIEEGLFYWLSQINCSPKLSNSGMDKKQCINPEAIGRIMKHPNYQFKFVISNENDIKEMFDDFIIPFKIPLENVYCMPGMDEQSQFLERTRWCMEMAKKYRFTATTRMHLAAWDKVLNV